MTDIKNNTGIGNSGYCNSGNCNSGNRNSGYYNSGYCNSGYYNSGNRNSGYCNSGYYNSGDRNSGYYNSGNRNSGYYNSGYCNSGYCNSGYYNSGDYNSGNRNSGWFNTDEPTMRFFGKDSGITYTKFCVGRIVYPDLKITAWVYYKDLSKDEQTTDTKNMDGMLKTLTYKEAWAEYWTRASEEDKNWFMDLPNFDAGIFEEITGISIKAKEVSLSGKKVKVEVDGKTFAATID
jgi:hypothetical protein